MVFNIIVFLFILGFVALVLWFCMFGFKLPYLKEERVPEKSKNIEKQKIEYLSKLLKSIFGVKKDIWKEYGFEKIKISKEETEFIKSPIVITFYSIPDPYSDNRLLNNSTEEL